MYVLLKNVYACNEKTFNCVLLSFHAFHVKYTCFMLSIIVGSASIIFIVFQEASNRLKFIGTILFPES